MDEHAPKPFGKHQRMIVRQDRPFNAGPPPDLLCESAVTPVERFFVRNHGPVPACDVERYRLAVDGLVERPLLLSLKELRESFAYRSVAATLQCAGNRRLDLMAVAPVEGEVPWDSEAISTAVWGGVALGDVLRAAGIDPAARHAAFTGLDEVEREETLVGFGGSVPLAKALHPDTLLAFEMNGEPLPLVHGFPLRAVVPGYLGARSVKWLADITLQEDPSHNYFQTHAYRLFPASVSAENVVWEEGQILGDQAVTSAICAPLDGEPVAAGRLTVRGYAFAGERCVTRVELSLDGGATWAQAGFESAPAPGVWALWRAEIELAPGRHRLAVRAFDSAANTQPSDPAQLWNFKGYSNNAWHRIELIAR